MLTVLFLNVYDYNMLQMTTLQTIKLIMKNFTYQFKVCEEVKSSFKKIDRQMDGIGPKKM